MSKEELERYVDAGVRVTTREGYAIEGHVKAVRDGGINIGGAWYEIYSDYIIIPVELERLKTK